MAWEKRARAKPTYYYRSVKTDGRVKKQYIGKSSDPVVQLLAKGDALAKASAKAGTAALRTEQERSQELESWLMILARESRQIHNLYLAAYEPPRRPARETQPMKRVRLRPLPPVDNSIPESPTREYLQHLAQQANRGSEPAKERLRAALRANTAISRSVGDLAGHVEQTLVNLIAEKDLLLKESLLVQINGLRDSLRTGNPSGPLEGLLIDQIVCTYLELQFTRMASLQRQQHIRDSQFWDRRHERANERYTAAIRDLASIRGQYVDDRTGATKCPPEQYHAAASPISTHPAAAP